MERHAGADGEKIPRLDAKDRPTGDDLLYGEDAVAEGKFLFNSAVDDQLNFQSLQFLSRRAQQHSRTEASTPREILAEQIVGRQAFAPVDVSRRDVDQKGNAGDMLPRAGGLDSSAGLADHDGEASIGVEFFGKFWPSNWRAGGHERLGKFVKCGGDFSLRHGVNTGLIGEADNETFFRLLKRRQYSNFGRVISNFFTRWAVKIPRAGLAYERVNLRERLQGGFAALEERRNVLRKIKGRKRITIDLFALNLRKISRIGELQINEFTVCLAENSCQIREGSSPSVGRSNRLAIEELHKPSR